MPIRSILPKPGELLWYSGGSPRPEEWEPVIYLRHEGGNYGVMLHEGRQCMVHVSRLHRRADR